MLEIDPDLKRKLYATLENQQQTMKDWFVREAEGLIYGEKQISFLDALDGEGDEEK